MLEGVRELSSEFNQIVGNIESPSSLGQAPSSELVDLEEYLKRRDELIVEFNAKIAEVQAQIDSLNVEIVTIEGQVSYWGGLRDSWLAKWDSAKVILDAYNKLTKEVYVSLPSIPVERWPVVRAGLGQVFMYDHHTRLKWFPDANTFEDYGYGWNEIEMKDISWFYDKPIVESIRSELTGAVTDQIDTPHYEDYKPLLIVPESILANYKSAWDTDAIDEHSGGRYIWSPLETQVSSAESGYNFADGEYQAAWIALESKTRHMRDLQLAKEASEEEKRGALALWEVEYQAALERKRIEIASIARDVALGYPTMDAETARNIAEMAYAEALAKGFTRLADAIRIAGDLADEWEDKPVTPHYTTETIFCSSCGIKLEITSSDIETDNRELSCPECGFNVGKGIQVRVIELPEPEPWPVELEWYEKYWKYITMIGTGVGVTAIVLAIKKKK